MLSQVGRTSGIRWQLYVLGVLSPLLEQACAEAHIEVVGVGNNGSRPNDTVGRYLHLKRLLHANGACAAVWAAPMAQAFSVFGLEVAPIQILFSQYLHPRLDWMPEHFGRLTFGSPAAPMQTFNGRPWRVVPACVTPAGLPSRQEIERIRAEHGAPDTVILGTLARTEKLNHPVYLDTVATILKQHPKTIFLWTGREEHPAIVERFRSAGVLPRTCFIGWVDTRVYAAVFDILLDSFPLCNGITLLHAMEASTACVSIDDPLSILGRDLKPISCGKASGESYVSRETFMASKELLQLPVLSESPQAYIANAGKLIHDKALRNRVGQLLSTVYYSIYERPDIAGAMLAAHVTEILTEAAPRVAISGPGGAH
jgi:hypothetical protein